MFINTISNNNQSIYLIQYNPFNLIQFPRRLRRRRFLRRRINEQTSCLSIFPFPLTRGMIQLQPKNYFRCYPLFPLPHTPGFFMKLGGREIATLYRINSPSPYLIQIWRQQKKEELFLFLLYLEAID